MRPSVSWQGDLLWSQPWRTCPLQYVVSSLLYDHLLMFTASFGVSAVLLNNQNRMAKEKNMSSEVHHRADFGSVHGCVSIGRSDMVVAIIGVTSPILNVVHAANKDAVAHNECCSFT
uniref:Uncharacterized protein n=1 Tax=Tanacetum cinerariifolium TaxID=118510 RepID=A0A699GVX8_TANCI|nr:hypothetical protein [Tanacetum cinerariifolium]